MAELRLEDIGAILVALVLVGIGYAGLRTIYEYRAQIGLFIGALWRRYVAVEDWRAAMGRLADERDGVRGYADENMSAPPRPAHMSTQAKAPERGDPTAPGSGPGPDYGAVLNAVLRMDLTYDQAVRLAAAIKVGDKWWLSGKKLYSAAGGNHDSLLKNVSAVRGDIDPENAPEDLMLTPYAGRATRASFYPNDPDLEYQPPR